MLMALAGKGGYSRVSKTSGITGFGSCFDVSNNGQYMVVKNSSSNSWVYLKDNASWSLQTSLVVPSGSFVSEDVLISADGSVVLARYASTGDYIVRYERTGTTWAQVATIALFYNPSTFYDTSRFSAFIGTGSNRFVSNSVHSNSRVYEYTFSGGAYTLTTTIDRPATTPGSFGKRVYSTRNGDWLGVLVGNWPDGGSVCFYSQSSLGTLHSSFTISSTDGNDVLDFAISDDLLRCIVLTPLGCVLYTRSGTTWTRQGFVSLTGGTTTNGHSMSCNTTGSICVVGRAQEAKDPHVILTTTTSISLAEPIPKEDSKSNFGRNVLLSASANDLFISDSTDKSILTFIL